jgi:small-conductance mechanosensitive channel
MATHIPNSFFTVLQLALVFIFLIMALAGLFSTYFTKKNGLIFLATQTAGLFFMLAASRAWIYPLVFAPVFDTEGEFTHTTLTIAILAVGFAVDVFVRMYVWTNRYFRRNGGVPGILAHLAQAIIYLFAFVIILQFVFHESVTAIATLSGAAALILGMSAQATLGEMFAGLAISISKPFKLGDWIKVGELEEGQVVNHTWRHAVVRLRDNTVINVNNSVIAAHPIRNFSTPSGLIQVSETVSIKNSADPYFVQKVIAESVEKSAKQISDTLPEVLFFGANKDGNWEYKVTFSIADFEHKSITRAAIWKAIVDSTKANNIELGA